MSSKATRGTIMNPETSQKINDEIEEQDKYSRRIAVLKIPYRMTSELLAQVFELVPKGAHLVEVHSIDSSMNFQFFFRSDKFKPVPFGDDCEEITVELEYKFIDEGNRRPVVKSINWPIEVEFPGLKR